MITFSKRSRNAQSLHDMMVEIRANNLRSDGYDVSADIPGFPQPPTIKGYIPDIYAVKGYSKIITEAETCDTIGSQHTKEQYKAFSSVLGAEFHVVVPKSCLSDAKRYAELWGIKVNEWWYQEGY